VIALKPRPFLDNLCKKLAGSMNRLRLRVSKFMQLEELREFKTKVIEDTEIQRIEREVAQKMRQPRRPREFLKSIRFSQYTPLIAK